MSHVKIKRVMIPTAELAASLSELILQLGPKHPREVTIEWLLGVVAQPRSCLLVAYADGIPVGLLALASFAAVTGYKTWIEDVVVDESHRGKGVGTALVRAALSFADSSGIPSINLSCKPSRLAANELYRKEGFKINATNYWRYTFEGGD